MNYSKILLFLILFFSFNSLLGQPCTPGPEGNFSFTPNSGIVPANVTFTITDTSNVNSYTWNFGDFTTEMNISPVIHTYTSSGTFYPSLTISDADGCVLEIYPGLAIVISGTTGVEKLSDFANIIISPNPVRDNRTVTINTKTEISNPKIIIYDISGREVKELSEVKRNEVKISLNGLSKGVYFVKLLDRNGREYCMERLIIE